MVQHYKHYKSLYDTKLAQSSIKTNNETQTELDLYVPQEHYHKIVQERDIFESKYRNAAVLLNTSMKNLEEYQRNYVICASENRALGLALSRFDKNYTAKPIDQIDEIYQKGFEEWKNQNPEFVNRYILKKI